MSARRHGPCRAVSPETWTRTRRASNVPTRRPGLRAMDAGSCPMAAARSSAACSSRPASIRSGSWAPSSHRSRSRQGSARSSRPRPPRADSTRAWPPFSKSPASSARCRAPIWPVSSARVLARRAACCRRSSRAGFLSAPRTPPCASLSRSAKPKGCSRVSGRRAAWPRTCRQLPNWTRRCARPERSGAGRLPLRLHPTGVGIIAPLRRPRRGARSPGRGRSAGSSRTPPTRRSGARGAAPYPR